MRTKVRDIVLSVLGAVLAITLVATALVVLRGAPSNSVTAYFSQTIGVYVGSDVRLLGVKIGTIESVKPEPSRVKVTLRVDRKVPLPADTRALVVAPSVVADRYVQLTPAYTGGPKLADGGVIPDARTTIPVEIDKLYDTITKLSNDLGPNGLNKNGSLSNALRTGASNLSGNGKSIGTTLENLGQAAKTLTGSQKDLFATIDNLQKLVTMLRANDGQVRQAERQLAEVTQFLADDRANLGAALTQLATALGKVKVFIQDNRKLIRSNVDKLATITQVLVDQRKSLAEALDVLPLSVGNVLNAYNPKIKGLMGRGNLNELSANPPLPLPSVDGGGR